LSTQTWSSLITMTVPALVQVACNSSISLGAPATPDISVQEPSRVDLSRFFLASSVLSCPIPVAITDKSTPGPRPFLHASSVSYEKGKPDAVILLATAIMAMMVQDSWQKSSKKCDAGVTAEPFRAGAGLRSRLRTAASSSFQL
jgi:hypothetical protein